MFDFPLFPHFTLRWWSISLNLEAQKQHCKQNVHPEMEKESTVKVCQNKPTAHFESACHLEQIVKKKSFVFTLWCRNVQGSFVLIRKCSRLLHDALKTGSRVCHTLVFFCSVSQDVSALWFIMRTRRRRRRSRYSTSTKGGRLLWQKYRQTERGGPFAFVIKLIDYNI